MSQQEQIHWSRMSLEDLQQVWNTEVEPNLRRDGLDLENRPSYEEIADAGYGGITYALREHHDMTLTEFLATVGYVEEDTDPSYQWKIDDETTIDELESYLGTLEERRGLAGSTIRAKQSRLATYARCYRDVHGRADLVDRVADAAAESDEIRRTLAVFDELDADLSTDASKLRYHSDISQFYDHLERRAIGAFNPVTHVPTEFNWSREEKDNLALTSDQVGRLYDAAESPIDELVVLGLCAWGLRRSEVAALHTSQLVLEGDDPRITFDDERKNGPGTVALIYGVPELNDRIDALGQGDESRDSYLFPSTRSASGHVTGETIHNRFQKLAERAEVRVRGDKPTSKMGRRFWYTTYNQAMTDLRENLDIVAADQGSSDPSVVLNNYLSEAERRTYRRRFMRERLAEAFEG